MRPDGTGVTQLTSDTNSSFQPTWSPDGTQIAFAKGPDGGFTSDIYVMNSDGTGVTNLTNDSTHSNISPAWSPNSTTIAFDSSKDGSEDIWVMNATNGTGKTNLTGTFVVTGNGRLSQERWPAWSPDSSKIAFYTNLDGLSMFHIYLITPDGLTLTQQTNTSSVCSPAASVFDDTPTWSPDGTKIAFSSNRSCTGNHIFVMDATTIESGSNVPVDVSNGGALNDVRPNWAVAVAPCGKRVCH